jgi:hypothetical protein
MNETKIRIKQENKIIKAKGGKLKKLPLLKDLIKEPVVGPWKFKCQYENYDYKG